MSDVGAANRAPCPRRWGTAQALFGPAFVAAVAYVDPGNFAINFVGGAQHGYELVWVIVMANLMAILVQYLTSKAGLGTGRNLPELCRERFGKHANAVLWLQAELVAMATDIAEFVGAAVGLNLVFGIPLFSSGLLTAVAVFAVLAVHRQDQHRFETTVVALLALVAAGFIYLLFAVGHQDAARFGAGLLPRLHGDAIELSVGIVGATVMPHAVYLHSALRADGAPQTDVRERRLLLTYNKWDCIIGLGIAGLVNLSMLCTAAALFRGSGQRSAGDLGAIHIQLSATVGSGAALAFGVALIAAGLSSSIAGTFAGQIVMAGFMNWRIPLVLRRALTVLPSLVVLGLSVNPTQALVYSQIVLSLGIPFALVPLVMVTADAQVMHDMVNRRATTVVAVAVIAVIVAMNAYLLYTMLT